MEDSQEKERLLKLTNFALSTTEMTSLLLVVGNSMLKLIQVKFILPEASMDRSALTQQNVTIRTLGSGL